MTHTTITPGLYRHSKGATYWVRGEAINTTNDAGDERMVVYVKAEDKDKPDVVPFVRRKAEFEEVIPWPDGFPRRRWMPEESFKRKPPRNGEWVGTWDSFSFIVLRNNIRAMLGDSTLEPDLTSKFNWFAWACMEAYLEDVLDPRFYETGRSHGYVPNVSSELLLPKYEGDREAMIAEVRLRLADVGYVRIGRSEVADLPALVRFLDEKVKPLAEEERRRERRFNSQRNHGRCY